jgi:hypothetical protein
MYRKRYPIELLFISLSEVEDAQDTALFTNIFSPEIIPAYAPDDAIRDGLKETFNNIG